MVTEEQLNEILLRGIVNVIPGEDVLRKKLESGDTLNVYLGIDPTATRIHVGHAVALRKLQHFADLGHKVTFLIGDFTALIGDTSDKNDERPVLTSEQIEENFQTYKKQAEKVINFEKVNVVHNSEWLNQLTFKDIVELLQHFSLGDFVSREMIRDRMEAGKRVGLHEAIYPVMQGYDSFHLDTDVQIGGADQTFNMQAGRTLLKDYKQKESVVLVTDYLLGTDGRKMSKSWGNAIWLDDEPNEIYGKVMSLQDELIPNYLKLATSLPLDQVQIITELSKKEPLEAKKTLAFQITKELHNEELAEKAQEYFEKTFQKKEVSENIEVLTLTKQNINIVELLVDKNLADSNSDAKRLVKDNAIELDGKVISDPTETVSISENGSIIRVGKKIVRKLILK